MSNKTQVKSKKKGIAAIKKIIDDKKAIHAQIKNGGNISDLKSKSIRFVKPL